MHYLLGDIPRSLQDIQQVLTLEPRHFGALSGRGQCMLQMQQFDDALGAFEAALTIHPWLPAARQQIEMLQTILNQRNKPI